MAYIGEGIKQGTFKVLDTSGNTYNGSNVTFSLGTQVGSAAQLLVSHDGVIQKPGTDYTLASGGASITFSTAPASGASIFITEISGAVGGTVTPSDASVTTDKLGADAVTSAKIADDSISDEHLDITAITGQTAITSLADTDKFLVSDASDSGNLKYVEKQYLPAGSWVLLETETVSSATSTVEINSMSSSYKTHAVVFDNVIPSSDNDTVRHAIKNSGGSVIQLYNGGDVSILDESGNRSDDTYGQNPTGYGTLAESNGSGSNEGFSGLIYYDSGMFDANLSTKYWGHIISFRANNTYAHSECYGRFANDTASAISYGFNAGNIASGTFKLYGIGG